MSATFFAAAPKGMDPAVIELLAEEVQAVERVLCEETSSDVELVESICRHTLQAGGKRLRPALVTLCAASTELDFDRERTRKLGACMELIHMATLMHDDVIDRSTSRRGAPTAAAAYGTTGAVLSGDVMLAKSMRILALDGDLEAIRNVSKVVVDLAEGEVYELQLRGRIDVTETEHLRVLEMKTATFIQVCCDLGGLCAAAPLAVRDALRKFGFHLGMAFQIVDDLLDYRGDTKDMGKPRAADFREGCATLPLIRLWPSLSTEDRAEISNWFGESATDEQVDRVCGLMADRGAFESCFESAKGHVDSAIGALSPLADGAEKELLVAVAQIVLTRTM